MNPTLKHKDFMILNKNEHELSRFEVVVIDDKFNGTDYIKRIIGLPGEEIEYIDNKLYINGIFINEEFINEEIVTNDFKIRTIPNNCYFVLGDNRMNSEDSRSFGFVNKKYITGTTNIIVFPFSRMRIIN